MRVLNICMFALICFLVGLGTVGARHLFEAFIPSRGEYLAHYVQDIRDTRMSEPNTRFISREPDEPKKKRCLNYSFGMPGFCAPKS
jgi:hypothetical protein